MPSPLTTLELDRLVCSDEGCTNTACDGEMFFHSHCHPGEPTWTRYEGKARTLTVSCAVCSKVIAVVKVSSG